ncbi:hypothetical protein BC938DRAFT_478230 [Jimgerdemannia flammicorona]|uniref:Uncharacterized protein n=1 Tax=Jimgerdemannia flammicorona TaxID=994334 RepID=A0A433QN57_9FUNG|nr:hypothetical protein BC938DRAFT_478230 [Jimgerdemannia flammicorona]
MQSWVFTRLRRFITHPPQSGTNTSKPIPTLLSLLRKFIPHEYTAIDSPGSLTAHPSPVCEGDWLDALPAVRSYQCEVGDQRPRDMSKSF